ncbi:MAG: alkaline phosphatase family protein, partial [Candidatus Aenigmarchaeota archaeon]|nr:alkaline phosphatase family protein [Candidatus Aenigmarchaeota archaeon]
MISGLGAPEDGNIFYPPELKDKLKKAIGKHKIYVPFARPKYTNPKYFIKDIEELINYNYRLADYLIDDTYDFFIFVISASDFLGHYGWHWWEDKNNKYHKIFKDLWRKIDEVVGLMVERWGDGYIMVISDHGMGRLKEVFLINKWLQQEGFLVLKGDDVKLSGINLKRNIKILLRTMFDFITKLFPTLGDYILFNFVRKMSKNKRFSQEVDFVKSKAFALDHCGLGNIYINAIDEKEREYVKSTIKFKLLSFFNSIGKNLELYSNEEVYTGKFLNNLPDLIFMIDSNLVEVNPSIREGKIIRAPLARNKTGSHRLEGILIVSGNSINQICKKIDFHKVDLTNVSQIVYILMNEMDFQNKTKSQHFSKKLPIEKQEIVKKLEDLGYL